MWMAITRETVRRAVISPEQTIRDEALRMWTLNGAYLSFEENRKGSIEPATWQTWWSSLKNYLHCPVDDIRNIEALLT
jgi:predicted amidohydrolase YtcJ